jgi:hypothetical protein
MKSGKKAVNDDAIFENDAVDPGFSTDNSKLPVSKEKLSENPLKDNENLSDVNDNDALNYKNDRAHGAFNPKNI